MKITNRPMLNKSLLLLEYANAWYKFFKLKKDSPFVVKETSQAIFARELIESYPEIKIISLVRDPRDVLLSFSNHLKLSHEDVFGKMISMDHFELDENDPDLKEGYKRSLLGSWSNHYLSWKSYKGRELLFLKYEDLVKNPYENFHKVLTYLKNFVPLELDSEKIRSSIKITSFENLKKNEEDEGFIEQGMSREFFRKGIIGDWKSSLKPELLKKIESKFKKEMIKLGYI